MGKADRRKGKRLGVLLDLAAMSTQWGIDFEMYRAA